MNKTYELKLTGAFVQVIDAGLQELPHKFSAQVIEEIRKQILKQNSADEQEPAEA